MFISKLRPNDSVGLTTFNTEGQIIFAPTLMKNLSNDVYTSIDAIKTYGGTTVRSGF